MLSQGVRLLVCLSVTRRYSVGTAKHIIFRRLNGHTILVFHSKRYGSIPTGRGMQGAGVRQTCDFRPIARFISENL